MPRAGRRALPHGEQGQEGFGRPEPPGSGCVFPASRSLLPAASPAMLQLEKIFPHLTR